MTVEKIISSPLVRARQTASIVHEGLGIESDIEFSDALPTDDIGGIVKAVRAHAWRENVMLVGHEPTLSRLISLLISGAQDAAIDLMPGALCKLTIDAIHVGQCGAMQWLMAPKQLVSLGK